MATKFGLKFRPGACQRCCGDAYLDMADDPEWRCLQCARPVQSRSVMPIAIIVASVALALSLVGGLSISSVATAAEEVPSIAQMAVEDLNEQTQGDETQPPPSQPQMMYDDGDVWNGWWIIMPIMMVLFWGGVIALAVWVVRQSKGDRAPNRSPLDIARERLARGEISNDEFDGIRRNLAQ